MSLSLMYVFLGLLLLFLFATLVRNVIMGPAIWDRLLGMSVISTKIILIIVFFASINNEAFFLDFAIVYALFGFLSIIFIALFLSERSKRGKD